MADPDVDQLIDQAVQPETPAQPKPSDSEKLGTLVNENAELRRQQDSLRAELEAMKAQLTRPAEPAAVTPKDDWQRWSHEALKEIAADDFLTDPKGAMEQALAVAGKQLYDHTLSHAEQRAWGVATAMRADMEFTQVRPDLMATEMGKLAVKQAIAQVQTDPRFAQLVATPNGRVRAWDLIGRIADKALGKSDALKDTEGLFDAPQRRSTYAAPSGVRLGGPGRAPGAPGEDGTLGDMVKYVRGNGRGDVT